MSLKKFTAMASAAALVGSMSIAGASAATRPAAAIPTMTTSSTAIQGMDEDADHTTPLIFLAVSAAIIAAIYFLEVDDDDDDFVNLPPVSPG